MADAKKPARRPSTAERLGTAIRRAAADAAERPESTYDVKRGELASHSRRNFLLFGAGALATAVTGWWVLPERTKQAWLPAGPDRLHTPAAPRGPTPRRRAATPTGWWVLPERTKQAWLPAAHDRLDTLAARVGLTRGRREATLDRVLTFDDDVAEALYRSEEHTS